MGCGQHPGVAELGGQQEGKRKGAPLYLSIGSSANGIHIPAGMMLAERAIRFHFMDYRWRHINVIVTGYYYIANNEYSS